MNFIDLERKISVRANRDELIQKGILFLDNPMAQTHTISETGTIEIYMYTNKILFVFTYTYAYIFVVKVMFDVIIDNNLTFYI